MRSFTIRPGPRGSAALGIAAVILLGSAIAAVGKSARGIETALRWCNDRIIAAAGSREDAVVALGLAALTLVSSIVIVRMFLLVVRELSGSSSFARLVRENAIPVPRNVRIAADDVAYGIPVTTVADQRPFAVAVGLLSANIVISDALVSRCTLEELRAVLAHEAAHCRARHPLQALLWEGVRRLAVLTPTIDDITAHLALSRELEADAAARAAVGRRPLVSAMLKAIDIVPEFSVARFGMLGDRAAALSSDVHAPLRLDTSRLAMTAATIAALALLAGTLDARASTAPELCVSDLPAMSTVNFSPYLSFAVAPASAVPARSDEVPLTSSAR